jgi:hypothetical protein
MRFRASVDYGMTAPDSPVHVWLETSSDGASWSPLVDFGELVPGVDVFADTPPVSGGLRCRWTFAPSDSRHWSLSVSCV